MRQIQKNQDRLWEHFQSRQAEVFDLSYPRLLFFARKCRPGEVVLNVGIGNGLLEHNLLARGDIEIHTLDPSRTALRRARKILGVGFHGRQGYLESAPFEDRQFDRVICTEVLEHLAPVQLPRALHEIRRILKPSGIFQGSVPYRENLGESSTVCPKCGHLFHRWGHLQGGFDKAKMKRLLEKAGFRVRQCHFRTFVDYRRTGLRSLFRALFRRLLGFFGEAIVHPSLIFEAVKNGDTKFS